MNKHRHPNLPSISTLLTGPPSPPPPIIVIDEEHSPSCSPNKYHLSPVLSPIDSYASSPNSSLFHSPLSPLPSPSIPHNNNSLPPLQGDDPPQRLRHPSVSSTGSVSPKPSFNTLWSNAKSPTLQVQKPYHEYSLSSSPPSSYRSPSQHDITKVTSDQSRSPSPMVESLPPSTQIILTESGQPILKRRRGRPPNLREPALEGGWTFLTPTVWDVKNNSPDEDDDKESLSTDSSAHQEQVKQANHADFSMGGSMAAFTSSNMDMVLQMPRKKRGRKPKTHIAGNSCFVWKDISSSRRSSKVPKPSHSNFKKLRPTT
ncbi:hypothetical protein BD560DRAFT_396324 [Blakeslea trispora]|nr:hypothetical protein BD560DRAFT_396324 [Blakeslea trispora]